MRGAGKLWVGKTSNRWLKEGMRRILIATQSVGKAREFREMLSGFWEVKTLRDLPEVPEIAEDGSSFEENAWKKARALAGWEGEVVMADDSGLEVDALGGAPGVHSARYAGVHGDDEANNRKLLKALAGVPEAQRGAQFRCVLVVCLRGVEERVFAGVCRGKILEVPRGKGGFGYDPLFVPDGWTRSMAELTAEEKNRISHRGQALHKAAQWLQRVI